jgi:type IV secretory pathway ATPase VirB11/archaellum biosynthesis ATPase
LIPPDERILLIEDTEEIQLHHENLVRFDARGNRTALPPSRFATCSKPLSAISQTEFFSAKSGSAKRLISCSS